jgi:hypothetical protein
MRASKPTVFFSHSSRDADVVQRVQRFVAERTGRAVELFVSSDGQSIPGGQNWSARLHDALKGAQLMFVFVSPRSLDSRWIYFEAGYVYRAEIAVVPLGILGVALDRIPAPLNILQGFEIRSPDGLGNVIDRINRTFDFGFDTRVSAEEYDAVFAEGESDATGLDGVAQIEMAFGLPPLPDPPAERGDALRAQLETVVAALRSHGIAAAAQGDIGMGYGEGFTLRLHGTLDGTLDVHVDPLAYARLAPAIHTAVTGLGTPPDRSATLFIRLARDGVVATQPLRESVLLGRAGVATVGDSRYALQGTEFFLGPWQRDGEGPAWRYVEIETTVGAAASVPVLAIARRVREAVLVSGSAVQSR